MVPMAFILLLSRQALPLRRHIYLASQREEASSALSLNGKVNQILAQQRKPGFPQKQERFVADV